MILADKVCIRYLVPITTFKVIKDTTFIQLKVAPQFNFPTGKKNRTMDE